MVDGQVSIITADGHVFMLDRENGIQLAQSDGAGGAEVVMQFKEGKVIISATDGIQLVSNSIELGGGITAPRDNYPLSSSLLADLCRIHI